MARMEALHKKIEGGGSAKAREKHIARGKMLPREYVATCSTGQADTRSVAESQH